MGQKLTFYPLGNAETCLLELENGGKLLFDYAAMNDGSTTVSYTHLTLPTNSLV